MLQWLPVAIVFGLALGSLADHWWGRCRMAPSWLAVGLGWLVAVCLAGCTLMALLPLAPDGPEPTAAAPGAWVLTATLAGTMGLVWLFCTVVPLRYARRFGVPWGRVLGAAALQMLDSLVVFAVATAMLQPPADLDIIAGVPEAQVAVFRWQGHVLAAGFGWSLLGTQVWLALHGRWWSRRTMFGT